LYISNDNKIYASNDKQLETMVNIVKSFSDNIKMSFGIEKCNKLTIVRGEIVEKENLTLDTGEQLNTLEHVSSIDI